MKKAKSWVINIVKFTLFNLKWIVFGMLVPYLLFCLEKGTAVGLSDEEAVWLNVLIVATVLLFVFDKRWKKIYNKICEMLYQWLR